jgi:hypothetical protein
MIGGHSSVRVPIPGPHDCYMRVGFAWSGVVAI